MTQNLTNEVFTQLFKSEFLSAQDLSKEHFESSCSRIDSSSDSNVIDMESHITDLQIKGKHHQSAKISKAELLLEKLSEKHS